MHIIEKEHSVEKTSKCGEMELLNRIIDTISKETNLSSDYYLKNPDKIAQLTSILHFALFIFCQNRNVTNFSQQLNEIFAEMVMILMKKVVLIESILIETKEKARGYSNGSFSIQNENKYTRCGMKQASVKEFCQQVNATTNIFGLRKISSKILNSPNYMPRYVEKKHTVAITRSKLELISPKANVIKAISNELRSLDTDYAKVSLFTSLKSAGNQENTGDANNCDNNSQGRTSLSNSGSLKL
jgi:hypothetical protein